MSLQDFILDYIDAAENYAAKVDKEVIYAPPPKDNVANASITLGSGGGWFDIPDVGGMFQDSLAYTRDLMVDAAKGFNSATTGNGGITDLPGDFLGGDGSSSWSWLLPVLLVGGAIALIYFATKK